MNSKDKSPQTPGSKDSKDSKKLILSPFQKPSSSSNLPYSSNLPLQNRFSPISNQVAYSQVLQNPVMTSSPSKNTFVIPKPTSNIIKSPFKQPQSSQSPSAKAPKANDGSYVQNPRSQTIKILEEEEFNLYQQSFHKLTEFLFPKDSLFIGCKPRDYYEAILIDTGSVRVWHIRNEETNIIEYSKLQIFRILTLSDWNSRPYINKTLSNYPNNPVFNYYDYIDAWYNTLYLRSFTHSWFIFFDLNFDFHHGYPEWFVKWFLYMGNILDTFPLSIRQGLTKFQELFPQDIPETEYILQFSMLFKIPWIMTWTFSIKPAQETAPPFLLRAVRIKWWNKLKEDQKQRMTVQGVLQWYSTNYYVPTAIAPSQQPSQHMDEDEDDVDSFLKADSREEIKKLIKEMKNKGEASSSTSQEEKPPTPLQDSQDPYESYSPYN